MAKEGFILYKSMYEPIRSLTTECKGMLLDAIYLYHIDGTLPDASSPVYMAFMFFKNQFDIDEKKYRAKCQKNSDVAKMRWNANAYERMQPVTNHADKGDKIEDKGKKKEEKEKDESTPAQSTFDKFTTQLKADAEQTENPTAAGQERTGQKETQTGVSQTNTVYSATEHRKRLNADKETLSRWFTVLQKRIPAAQKPDLLMLIDGWDLLFDGKYPAGAKYADYTQFMLWRINEVVKLPVKPTGQTGTPNTTTKPKFRNV